MKSWRAYLVAGLMAFGVLGGCGEGKIIVLCNPDPLARDRCPIDAGALGGTGGTSAAGSGGAGMGGTTAGTAGAGGGLGGVGGSGGAPMIDASVIEDDAGLRDGGSLDAATTDASLG